MRPELRVVIEKARLGLTSLRADPKAIAMEDPLLFAYGTVPDDQSRFWAELARF